MACWLAGSLCLALSSSLCLRCASLAVLGPLVTSRVWCFEEVPACACSSMRRK